jgi:putative tricarboxylic transport membrane protein
MSGSTESSAALTDPSSYPSGSEPIRIAMDKRVDLLLALGLAGLGIFICYVASGFRVGVFPDPVTARGLPYICGGFMIVAGFALAVRRLLTWSKLPGVSVVSEGTDDEPGHPASAWRTAGVVALTFLWIWLLRSVGYLILSPLVLFGMLWLMDVRSKLVLMLFPLGFTLVVWLIFSVMLNIVIPLGPLMPLARRWGVVP